MAYFKMGIRIENKFHNYFQFYHYSITALEDRFLLHKFIIGKLIFSEHKI